MKTIKLLIATLMALSITACAQSVPGTIVWSAENQPEVLEIFGSPTMIETPLGSAIHFNGNGDAVSLAGVPISGMEEFTMEAIIRQDGDGAFEERFIHMGNMGPRVMFETRTKPDKTWYFDAHVNFGNGKSATLIDPNLTHPTDQWYNVTLVATKEGLTSYVNGVEQCKDAFSYEAGIIGEGFTSVGVRQNKVNWFKGDIYKLRFTPKALKPSEFLKDYEKLNK